jgi:FkbH-like protein
MLDESALFPRLSSLVKGGAREQARAELRDALRRGVLGPAGIDRAGRFLEKVGAVGPTAHEVLLLGQCTTSWLAPSLAAFGLRHDLELRVEQGGYDNVLQEVTARTAAGPADVLVLLPWHQRVLSGDDRAPTARIEEEVAFWREVWRTARERGFARVVQIGFDWVGPGASGFALGSRASGDVALIRDLNRALLDALPSDAFFVDLELVSGLSGRARFYDPRQYHWTKQPFSQCGVAELAAHVLAGIRALLRGPKKVLVVDLDDTLWGGVVGETGPLGIALGEGPDGEAFQAFQRYLKGLGARGILLAAASKNNLADAREPFEKHPSSVLTLDDFAAFEACWEPKAQMLARIAARLNLGTDSFVFFDDSPAEREHVRQAVPQVEVVDVPAEPAEYVRALELGGWFETVALTDEDRDRTRQYALERERCERRAAFVSLDDYLRSLEMRALVVPIDEGDLGRVAQLLAKTNQFNLTAQRHSEERVREMIGRPGHVCLGLRLRDRFGDYGLVACLLGVPAVGDPGTLRIDSWLMSCRVIGRSVEQCLFGELVARAVSAGYRRLLGEYRPTPKNAQVAALYPELGFAPLERGAAHGAQAFQLDLPPPRLPRTFVLVSC